jgi:hypothetical protein
MACSAQCAHRYHGIVCSIDETFQFVSTEKNLKCLSPLLVVSQGRALRPTKTDINFFLRYLETFIEQGIPVREKRQD